MPPKKEISKPYCITLTGFESIECQQQVTIRATDEDLTHLLFPAITVNCKLSLSVGARDKRPRPTNRPTMETHKRVHGQDNPDIRAMTAIWRAFLNVDALNVDAQLY
jgi:hypothetical protein